MRTYWTLLAGSLICVGLVGSAAAQDRSTKAGKVQGVSIHAVSTVPGTDSNQHTWNGQTYFVSPKPMFSADQITSARSAGGTLTLAVSGDAAQTGKANQVGILIDGQLTAVGVIGFDAGQVTISGLGAQADRVSHLLDRKTGSLTGPMFAVIPAGQANGEYIFDVYLQNAADVRTYQVKLTASGGTSGSLTMTDIRIDEGRADFLFAGNEAIKAADHGGSRLGGTLFSGSVDASTPMYLGTWRFQPSPDAAGTFDIKVTQGSESFLSDSRNNPIPVSVTNATVQIGTKGRLSD